MAPNGSISSWLRGATLLFLLGCSSATGPTAANGTFDLVSLNDSTLPYDHEGLGCCTYLSGSLEITDGRYTISLTARNRNTTDVFTAAEWGKVTVRRDQVTFLPDSFVVVGFLLDKGQLDGDELRVSFGGEGPGSPDQFRARFVRE